MKKINILLWFFYLIIFPFQINEPGNLQIADSFLILGLLINYKMIILKFSSNVLIELKTFVFYTFLVSLFFSIIFFDIQFFKAPLNYFYCYLVCLLILHFFGIYNFVNVTLFSILISCLLQLLLYFRLDTSESFRISLFFNNPNQLAFYGIILNTFLFLLIPLSNYRFKFLLLLFLFLINSFLIILSISQTAIIITTLMFFYLLYKYVFKSIIVFIFISIFLAYLSINLNISSDNYSPIQNVLNRIESELDEGFDGDNGVEGRNYTRLIKFPEYLLFGAGEARLDRFDKNVNLEIHSVFANILFSYGFFGFLFFILFILKIAIKINFGNLVLFILFLLFTFPHNMLRWPLFWILMTYFYYLTKKNNYETNQIYIT